MSNVITSLLGEKLEGSHKWLGNMSAQNGSVYGIPYRARRVVKFNPVDNSMTLIGPDFGDGHKWTRGAMTESGIIYCPPYNSLTNGILKIDTNTDNVTVLDINFLPEQDYYMWVSCAAALDGCIYFMPYMARRIMKLDPNNNDAMSSVGDDLGDGTYSVTVVGIDGCVYGIPCNTKRILKYDPINDITSFVGKEASFQCNGNGALGRDGCIYALTKDGRVLKIDTVNNYHCFVGNSVDSDHPEYNQGWGDAILGIDGCIYWPPCIARSTLKYDPHTDLTSLVAGCDFGTQICKWSTGALATDDVNYCIPTSANQVLAIYPWGEFLETTKTNMKDHPDKFGFLFQKLNEVGKGSALRESQTNFDHAIIRFGQKQVYEVLEKAMKPLVNDYCKETNLCPFMIVASCAYKETSTLSAINHLLRRDLSWVNNCTTCSSLEGKMLLNKKRKHNSVK